MNMIRDKVFFLLTRLLLVVCCILPSNVSALVDKTNVRRQIEYHRQWMKEHTPDPKSLNDSALIIETVRAIRSLCHEPQVGAVIRYSGKKYGLQELVEYAGMRDRQDIDPDDSKAIKCLELLTEEAHKRVGEVSYPRAYTFMTLAMTASSYEQIKHFSYRFHDTARSLYEQEPSITNHELCLMAQVSIRTVEEHYGENPTLYRDMRLLTEEIIVFYKAYQTCSDIQVYLLQAIDNYYINGTLYENYRSYVNRELLREGLIYHGSQNLTPEILGLSQGDEGVSRMHTKLLAKLLHPNHPDVLAIQASDEAMLWTGGDAFLERLHFIREFFKEYDLRVSPQTRNIKNAIRYWQVINQTSIEDTTFMEDLSILKSYLSETSEPYFTALSSTLDLILHAKSSQIEDVVTTLDSLLPMVSGDDPIKKLFLSNYKTILQRAGMSGHEYDFFDQAQEYLDCCDHYPNWNTIALGKILVSDATMMGDASTALALQRRLTSLLRSMVGELDPIFVIEYLYYGQLARDITHKDITTLDGQQDADSLFIDLIRCAPVADVEVNAYLCAGDFFCHRGQHQQGRGYLLKALRILHDQAALISPTDSSFVQSNHYDQATAYASLLHSHLEEFSDKDYDRTVVEQYGKELESLLNEMSFDPSHNFYFFKQLSDYYCITDRFNQAKQLLHKCLNYYDGLTGNHVDMPYLQILQTLINIAGHIENNLDECQILAERMERDLDGFENCGNFDNYITLLRTLYDLVEAKNPYDIVLLIRYLSLLDEAVDKYLKASNKDDAVWYNHGLYYATKYMGFVSRHDQLMNLTIANGGDIDVFNREWEHINEKVESFIVPELENRRQQLESTYHNRYQMPTSYYQILMCQATAAEYTLKDLEKAEVYYRELANYIGEDGYLLLGNFLILHKRWDDTFPVCEKLDSLFHLPENLDMRYPAANLMGKANTTGIISVGYLLSGHYDDALRLAYEFQGYMSAYIKQNFDFMTQNEREGFLNGNTSGSMPLLLLLPHMPDRIAGDVYNAVLRDKGLLLRTTGRLQRAIAASGNDTLIQAVDSLRMMQQQLSSIQSSTPDANIQFASWREQMDRLERYILRKSAPYRDCEDEVPTWQQVRNNLEKDEASVEFVMADTTLIALVLTKGCAYPQYVPLMGAEDGEIMIRMFQGKDPTQLADSIYGPGRTYLYEKLWKPLEAYFNGAMKIYYSPTSILNSLAFAAFTLPDGSYLIDHYELHQLTSTARIAYRSEKQKSKKKVLTANIYGALYYNDEQRAYYTPRLAEMRQSFQSDSYLAQTDKQRGQTESFPFLENSLYEADAITSLLSANGVLAHEHVGMEATEQAFRKLDGNSPDILLISTHGFFYNDPYKAREVPYLQQRQHVLNAMTSTGLILADGERAWQGEQLDDDTDNVLSAAEVASMNLKNTQLAVLSACETGLGTSNNEGVYGLQRGFKQAGVRSLCASLWSVNDHSTADLMQSFFRYWLSDKQEGAMQRAMIRAMKEQRERTPSPYYWAPFVLYDAIE